MNSSHLISVSEDLLRYLFDYLGYNERIQLILTNTIFTRTFLDSIRKIKRSISIKNDITKIKTDERLLSLVRDPYHQVEIREDKCDEAVLDLAPEVIEGLAPLQAVCRLEGLGGSFMKRFRYAFNRIQTLSLETGSRGSRTLLEYLRERSESLKLENLEIKFNNSAYVNSNVRDEEQTDDRAMVFPYIASLVSLQLTSFFGDLIPSQYGGLQKLVLISCPFLEDVSQFGNIYDLALVDCRSIKDISALKNNHTIGIVSCERIEDYSHSFENTVNISISSEQAGLYEKKSLSFGHLKLVQSLEIEGNYDLDHVFSIGEGLSPTLQGLRYLSLSCNRNVRSVEGLGSIPVLVLQYLRSLSSLEGLGKGNRKVSIDRCDGITDFSPLRFIDTVEIIQCKGFTNAAHIDHVKNVKLEGWSDFSSVIRTINLAPLKKHVQQLHLEFEFKNSFSLTGLKNIPVIEVGFDSDIKSIKTIVKKLFAGNHQKIVIHDVRDTFHEAEITDPTLMKKVCYNRYDMVQDRIYGYRDKVIVFLQK